MPENGTPLPARSKIMAAAEAIADVYMAECPADNLHEQQMHRYGMMFIQHLRAWAEHMESEANRPE